MQCENKKCQKWRKLMNPNSALPDKWYCKLNDDPMRNKCSAAEETWEEEDEERVKQSRSAKMWRRVVLALLCFAKPPDMDIFKKEILVIIFKKMTIRVVLALVCFA